MRAVSCIRIGGFIACLFLCMLCGSRLYKSGIFSHEQSDNLHFLSPGRIPEKYTGPVRYWAIKATEIGNREPLLLAEFGLNNGEISYLIDGNDSPKPVKKTCSKNEPIRNETEIPMEKCEAKAGTFFGFGIAPLPRTYEQMQAEAEAARSRCGALKKAIVFKNEKFECEGND